MFINNNTKITLLISTSIIGYAVTQPAFAANVPDGVKLAKKQEFVRGNGTEVATIDPQKSEGVPESNVIRDLLEGLVTQDADGKTIPGVAESWETTDNRTFVFIYATTQNGLMVTRLQPKILFIASVESWIQKLRHLTLGIFLRPK